MCIRDSTYTLTPYNAGPVDALAGWSVTDLLPTGLTFAGATGMDGGAAYTCSTSGATGTCTAAAPLKAKQFGPTITVTATIGANVTGSLKNVAYVAPSDLDGRETVPLVVPTTATERLAISELIDPSLLMICIHSEVNA